jgi:hypothetical protein
MLAVLAVSALLSITRGADTASMAHPRGRVPGKTGSMTGNMGGNMGGNMAPPGFAAVPSSRSHRTPAPSFSRK